MEALIDMLDYINEFREEYVVLMDSDTVLNIDLNAVIKFHEENGASVTFVTALANKSYTSRTPRMMIARDGKNIIDISMNTTFNPECPELCLNIFIIKTDDLKRMIQLATSHGIRSLSSVLMKAYRRDKFLAYSHQGYAATVSSLYDYYKYSMNLALSETARRSLLGNRSFPIYTRVKNSAPTSYTDTAEISESIIADDCIIEGRVKNSVIFRGVHIAKGATVTNSILFHGTSIAENARVNCIITDKNVSIGRDVLLSGSVDMPFYIEKNKRIIN
jgi:glucose-1-phosphate adenylyltransferase